MKRRVQSSFKILSCSLISLIIAGCQTLDKRQPPSDLEKCLNNADRRYSCDSIQVLFDVENVAAVRFSDNTALLLVDRHSAILIEGITANFSNGFGVAEQMRLKNALNHLPSIIITRIASKLPRESNDASALAKVWLDAKYITLKGESSRAIASYRFKIKQEDLDLLESATKIK